MLKLLRSLALRLAKVALSVAAIIFSLAVAVDLIGSVPLPVSRFANHAFVGLAVGAFVASFLALIAIVFHVLLRMRRDQS